MGEYYNEKTGNCNLTMKPCWCYGFRCENTKEKQCDVLKKYETKINDFINSRGQVQPDIQVQPSIVFVPQSQKKVKSDIKEPFKPGKKITFTRSEKIKHRVNKLKSKFSRWLN